MTSVAPSSFVMFDVAVPIDKPLRNLPSLSKTCMASTFQTPLYDTCQKPHSHA
jgi:hypothetical protein